MPTQNVNLSDQQVKFIRRSVGKLDTLRRLSNEAFDEIDRGEFEAVAIEGIDQFMARMDTKPRASRSP